MTYRPIVLATLATLLASAAPAAAQVPSAGAPVAAAAQSDFERFRPLPSGKATQIDYSFFDEALEYMVLRMGQSTRDGLGKPAPGMGTRRVYGHESRYRLEGNRIVFSYLDAEAITPLSEYRQDLERLGAELDIASLPRDEQLAYWMNLHNVAVIEQIAINYPVQSPSRMKLGAGRTSLDETAFITVAGVAMSPRDIRTKIVFPNWDNPNVIYGFFRGEIGGPSIQRRAFTGGNMTELLGISADEFVNSLRGVEGYGDNLLVSKIYEEAAPFYFPQLGADLRAHLAAFAGDDVKRLIAAKSGTKVNQYDDTIADLAAGDREPTYSLIESDGKAQSTRVSPSIARLLNERYEKYEKLRKEGLLKGRVIVLPMQTNPAPAAEDPAAAENANTE